MAKQNNFKTAVNELMGGLLPEDGEEDRNDKKERHFSLPRELNGSGKSNDASVSFIAADITIEGSITGNSSFRINGTVKGDVAIKGDLHVNGVVEGDAKGENIIVTESEIKGNMTVNKFISVDSNSVIAGNIQTSDVEINGKIKGDIRAKEAIVLKKEAVVFGNISARSFTMEAGANLKGQIEILSGTQGEKEFRFEKSAAAPAAGFAASPKAAEERKTDPPEEKQPDMKAGRSS